MGIRIGHSDTQVDKSVILSGNVQRKSAGKTVLQPTDGERTAAALKKTVEVEEALRQVSIGQADSSEGIAAFSYVPRMVLQQSKDPLEHGALITQLEKSMPFYEEQFAQRKAVAHANELMELRRQRITGLIRDAADVGRMAVMSVSTDKQQRIMVQLQSLLQAAEQTCFAVGCSVGEHREVTAEAVTTSRSAMVAACIQGMATKDPEHAAALYAQLEAGLVTQDKQAVEVGLSEGRKYAAVSEVTRSSEFSGKTDYRTARRLLDKKRSRFALDNAEFYAVRKQLQYGHARENYEEGKAQQQKRQQVVDAFYAHVDAGNIAGAVQVVSQDTSLTTTQRKSMLASLHHSEWKTDGDTLLTLCKKIQKNVKAFDVFDIIPGKDLSYADAMLLREVVVKKDARSVVENRLLGRTIEKVLSTVKKLTSEQKSEMVRALLQTVSESRKAGENPVPLLKAGEENSIYDAIIAAYSDERASSESSKAEYAEKQNVSS